MSESPTRCAYCGKPAAADALDVITVRVGEHVIAVTHVICFVNAVSSGVPPGPIPR